MGTFEHVQLAYEPLPSPAPPRDPAPTGSTIALTARGREIAEASMHEGRLLSSGRVVNMGDGSGPFFEGGIGSRVIHSANGKHHAYVGLQYPLLLRRVVCAIIYGLLGEWALRWIRRQALAVPVQDHLPWLRRFHGPDSVRMIAITDRGDLIVRAKTSKGACISINGRDGPAFHDITQATFDPETSVLTYVAHTGAELKTVRVELPRSSKELTLQRYEEIQNYPPV